MAPLRRRKSEADAPMEGTIRQLQFLLRTCRDVIQYLVDHPPGKQIVQPMATQARSDLCSINSSVVFVTPEKEATPPLLPMVSTSRQIPYNHEKEDPDQVEDVNQVCHAMVKCTLGCKQDVPFKDWNCHCLMHALESDEIRIQKNPAKNSRANRAGGGAAGGASSPGGGSLGDPHQTLLSQGLKNKGSLQNQSLEESMKELIISQMREPSVVHIEEGLMCLLQQCLESEEQQGGPSTIALSGYVEHFQCTDEEALGWDCGWRNLQMLSSNLLSEDKEASDVLFGGVGFVPDIQSMQKWLEIAWVKGFDVAGAEFFERKVHSTQKMIGAGECATLLRSFGLRSRILEFRAAGRKHERRREGRGKNGTNAEATTTIQEEDRRHLVQHNSTTEKSALGIDGGKVVEKKQCESYPGYDDNPISCQRSHLGDTNAACTTTTTSSMQGLEGNPNKDEQQESDEKTHMGCIDHNTTGNNNRDQCSSSSRGKSANEQEKEKEDDDEEQLKKESKIDHQNFINWVCDYFMNKGTTTTNNSSNNNSSSSKRSAPTTTTFCNRSPLYFQQQREHSLTIVGIERRPPKCARESNTNEDDAAAAADDDDDDDEEKEEEEQDQDQEVFFLVLDPSHKTQQILSCLRERKGWQSLMKRSAESLTQEAKVHQLCYLEKAGVAQGGGGEQELESLKLVAVIHHSIRRFLE